MDVVLKYDFEAPSVAVDSMCKKQFLLCLRSLITNPLWEDMRVEAVTTASEPSLHWKQEGLHIPKQKLFSASL